MAVMAQKPTKPKSKTNAEKSPAPPVTSSASAWTAAAIRALRDSLALDRDQFAERLHVSRETVVSWETGRRTPTAATSYLLDLLKTKQL